MRFFHSYHLFSELSVIVFICRYVALYDLDDLILLVDYSLTITRKSTEQRLRGFMLRLKYQNFKGYFDIFV